MLAVITYTELFVGFLPFMAIACAVSWVAHLRDNTHTSAVTRRLRQVGDIMVLVPPFELVHTFTLCEGCTDTIVGEDGFQGLCNSCYTDEVEAYYGEMA